jgi:hypothetical protein
VRSDVVLGSDRDGEIFEVRKNFHEQFQWKLQGFGVIVV